MSTFSENVLPEVPLEELIQLQLAIQLYYEVLKENRSQATNNILPLVSRMYGEVIEETERRLKGLTTCHLKYTCFRRI